MDKPILKVNGIVVLEHSKHEIINNLGRSLQVIRTENYGETIVTFLTAANDVYLEEDS